MQQYTGRGGGVSQLLFKIDSLKLWSVSHLTKVINVPFEGLKNFRYYIIFGNFSMFSYLLLIISNSFAAIGCWHPC